MTIQLRLANTPELSLLLPLVKAYHEFEGIDITDLQRQKAVSYLLADPALGGIWLILTDGQLVGYIALTFGYSIEFGGKDAFIDEFYIRSEFRGQGLGQQTLKLIYPEVKARNIGALHLEVDRNNSRAQQFYIRANFHPRDKYMLMSACIEP